MTAGIHRMRRVETGLAWATIVALLIYAPVETIYSWPGLTDPFYVIDVIGMALMMSGVVRSLRARPGSGAAMLAVGWAWTASNFWRATFDRVEKVRAGHQLLLGSLEFKFVCGELIVSLIALATAIVVLFFTDS
jgi:hypothetical protein